MVSASALKLLYRSRGWERARSWDRVPDVVQLTSTRASYRDPTPTGEPAMATAPPPARQRLNPRRRAAALPPSSTIVGGTTFVG
jgi:hypothetical protein